MCFVFDVCMMSYRFHYCPKRHFFMTVDISALLLKLREPLSKAGCIMWAWTWNLTLPLLIVKYHLSFETQAAVDSCGTLVLLIFAILCTVTSVEFQATSAQEHALDAGLSCQQGVASCWHETVTDWIISWLVSLMENSSVDVILLSLACPCPLDISSSEAVINIGVYPSIDYLKIKNVNV